MLGSECVKCGRPAVVHLTEVVTGTDGAKQILQLDLCLEHAVQGGMLASVPIQGHMPPAGFKDSTISTAANPVGILQSPPAEMAENSPADLDETCPQCGMTWVTFIKHGLMGCPNDYTFFDAKILDLVKRSHEGASQTVGKTPPGVLDAPAVRRAAITRLEYQLARALECEKYEDAARLRDEMNMLMRQSASEK